MSGGSNEGERPHIERTAQKPRQREKSQPLEGRAKEDTIFSPGEQQGSDTARLTPEEEKKMKELLQPEEGEASDVTLFAKRTLQALRALESRIEDQKFFNTQHRRFNQQLIKQAQEPGNKPFTPRQLLDFEYEAKIDEAYLKGFQDAQNKLQEHMQIRREKRPLAPEDDGE
jgi:hypothetical protein